MADLETQKAKTDHQTDMFVHSNRTGPLKRNYISVWIVVNVIEYVLKKKENPHMTFLSPSRDQNAMRTSRKDGTTMIFLSPSATRTLSRTSLKDETIMITLSPSRNKDAMRTSRKDEAICRNLKTQISQNKISANGNRTRCSGSPW